MTSPYRIPWRLTRLGDGSSLVLRNNSDETLHAVTFTLVGPGVIPVLSPLWVAPRGHTQISVRGDDLALSTLLFVGWLRENGDDYVWRVSF